MASKVSRADERINRLVDKIGRFLEAQRESVPVLAVAVGFSYEALLVLLRERASDDAADAVVVMVNEYAELLSKACKEEGE